MNCTGPPISRILIPARPAAAAPINLGASNMLYMKIRIATALPVVISGQLTCGS